MSTLHNALRCSSLTLARRARGQALGVNYLSEAGAGATIAAAVVRSGCTAGDAADAVADGAAVNAVELSRLAPDASRPVTSVQVRANARLGARRQRRGLQPYGVQRRGA